MLSVKLPSSLTSLRPELVALAVGALATLWLRFRALGAKERALLARTRRPSQSSSNGKLLPLAGTRVATEWLVRSEFLPNVSYHFKRAAMLKTAKIDKLMVVTDFDATLTTGKSIQCHDLVGFSPLMSQAFRDEFAPLLDWQSNAAIDGVEWWDTAHALMVKHGQPQRQTLPRMVREAKMEWRAGALDLLERLAALEVPVLIVSAGLTDVIEEFLRQARARNSASRNFESRNSCARSSAQFTSPTPPLPRPPQHSAWTENISICSNRLNYAADSVPSSIAPTPPITSFTKATAYSASSNFFKQHAARSTIVVMGDSCSDIDSAVNIPYEHMLSIGFLNDKPMLDAAKYAQTFDALVLGAEGSLAGVDALLDDIVAGPSPVASPTKANGVSPFEAAV